MRWLNLSLTVSLPIICPSASTWMVWVWAPVPLSPTCLKTRPPPATPLPESACIGTGLVVDLSLAGKSGSRKLGRTFRAEICQNVSDFAGQPKQANLGQKWPMDAKEKTITKGRTVYPPTISWGLRTLFVYFFFFHMASQCLTLTHLGYLNPLGIATCVRLLQWGWFCYRRQITWIMIEKLGKFKINSS